MIRIKLDLPLPFAPKTPILAPLKKAIDKFSKSCRPSTFLPTSVSEHEISVDET